MGRPCVLAWRISHLSIWICCSRLEDGLAGDAVIMHSASKVIGYRQTSPWLTSGATTCCGGEERGSRCLCLCSWSYLMASLIMSSRWGYLCSTSNQVWNADWSSCIKLINDTRLHDLLFCGKGSPLCLITVKMLLAALDTAQTARSSCRFYALFSVLLWSTVTDNFSIGHQLSLAELVCDYSTTCRGLIQTMLSYEWYCPFRLLAHLNIFLTTSVIELVGSYITFPTAILACIHSLNKKETICNVKNN